MEVMEQAQERLPNVEGGVEAVRNANLTLEQADKLTHFINVLGERLTDLDVDTNLLLQEASEFATKENITLPGNVISAINLMSDPGVRGFATSARNKKVAELASAQQLLGKVNTELAAQKKRSEKTVASYAKVISRKLDDLPENIPIDLYRLLKNGDKRKVLTPERLQKLAGRATLPELDFVATIFHAPEEDIANSALKANMTREEYRDLREMVKEYVTPLYEVQERISRKRSLYSGRAVPDPTDNIAKIFAVKDQDIALPVTSDNLLVNFPQWVAGSAKHVQKFKELNANNRELGKRLKQKGDKSFQTLESLNPNLVHWNPNRLSWEGEYIAKKVQSYQSQGKGLAKKLERVGEVLKKQLTPEQIATNVPPIITAITDSNAALSKAGFGPISSNEKAPQLFAGRWIDHTTGTIRQLPKASSKYLNPLSLGQRIAFVEARILNNWNEIVADSALRTRLIGTDAEEYAKKQMERIREGVSSIYGLWEFNEKISDEILKFFELEELDLSEASPKDLILHNIPSGSLMDIYNQEYPHSIKHGGDLIPKETFGFKFSKAQESDMRFRAQNWISKVDASVGSLAQEVIDGEGPYANYNSTERAQRVASITRAGAQLTNTNGPMKASLNKLVRAMTIPINASAAEIMGIIERVDENMQQVKNTLMTETQMLPDNHVQSAFKQALQPFLNRFTGAPQTNTDSLGASQIGHQLAKAIEEVPVDPEKVHKVPRQLVQIAKQRRSEAKNMREMIKYKKSRKNEREYNKAEREDQMAEEYGVMGE